MEIAPIPGIRLLPPAKAPLTGLRPPEVFEIEAAARPDEAEQQSQRRKATGAEENDPDDILLDKDAEKDDAPRQIDYFA